MKIEPAELQNREELRTLLLDAADQLAGDNARVLEPRLPWDGHPILLVDAAQHPVLVSFDSANPQAALLNGLNSVEMLTTALPWINRVYDALGEKQLAPRLVVVSHEPPPGAATILDSCRDLRLLRFRVLRVNGETGLLLEDTRVTAPQTSTADTTPAPAPAAPVVRPVTEPAGDTLPSLSTDEDNYFQQL